MWTDIISWTIDSIKTLGDFASWLFTPISIAGTKEAFQDYVEMNSTFSNLGLGVNFANWVSNNIPVTITPIEVLSVSFLTTMFVVWIVTAIFK